MCIARNGHSGHRLLALGATGDDNNLIIKAYEPAVPDVTSTLTGNPLSGYVNNQNGDRFYGFFVDDSYSRSTPSEIAAPDPEIAVEGEWRCCTASKPQPTTASVPYTPTGTCADSQRTSSCSSQEPRPDLHVQNLVLPRDPPSIPP